MMKYWDAANELTRDQQLLGVASTEETNKRLEDMQFNFSFGGANAW